MADEQRASKPSPPVLPPAKARPPSNPVRHVTLIVIAIGFR